MKRRLVLTNESARHRFRQALPPSAVLPLAPEPLGSFGLFALTFASAFLAFSSYLA